MHHNIGVCRSDGCLLAFQHGLLVLGAVWFVPQLAQPKIWHDQCQGVTKILVSCY